MTEPELRLAVDGLRVVQTRSGADVVDEVSFELAAGKTLGLVGESGSGKTTVALALLGYARRGLELTAGIIKVDGVDVLGMNAGEIRELRGSRVAYVPQDPASALHPALKIGTQLDEVFAGHRGHSDEQVDRRRVDEVLEEVRLDGRDVLGAYPHQLSGGQQQRVVLAMAFMLRPSVIVLDEPTTGLDVTTQRHVLDTIRELCTIHRVSGIFVSHDLAVIADLVDDVAVMYSGRIIERGRKPEVFGAPAHPYTRGLLRAVPSPSESQALVGLPGHPPSPRGRPPGCFFAPRCQYSVDRCRASFPPTEEIAGEAHAVRCFRSRELPPFEQRSRSIVATHTGPAGREDASLLTVRGLSASYGDTEVLRDIEWYVEPRECLAIVGESGSGKTTLARCVVGLHHRWAGEIALAGTPLAHGTRARPREALRSIQYVFQNPYGSLNPRKRVSQILELPLTQFFDYSSRERRRRIADALEAAALTADFRNRTPGELSGGERQRVAIARALVVEPRVIVCDEITSALDVSVQAAIVEVLRGLQAERGLALVFITHNLALVRSIAQRAAVMQDGRIVEQGDTDQVLDKPQAEYTQRLLADIPRPYDAEVAAVGGRPETDPDGG
jgi:peptide/nickel transport system ATP-binding protein